MTRDEIIKLAREAGGGLSCIAEPLEHPWKFSQIELERFAALVAAAEREACAQTIETWGASLCIKDLDMQRLYQRQTVWREHYAAAIRARGGKGGA